MHESNTDNHPGVSGYLNDFKAQNASQRIVYRPIDYHTLPPILLDIYIEAWPPPAEISIAIRLIHSTVSLINP